MFGLPSDRKPCAQSSQLLVLVVSTSFSVGVTPSAAAAYLIQVDRDARTSGVQLV